MFKNPFSYKGRIRRSEFGITFIIFFIIDTIIKSFTQDGSLELQFLGFIALLPFVWFACIQGAKRCHDLEKSGWWQIIPFYFLWMLFKDGRPGANEYGENPKGLNYDFDAFNPQPASNEGNDGFKNPQ
ncbi:DUF805 domain-containing protein [Pedobacter gandavensis]|uniref:DUF805 domain-containing protein n=1 Tax=Pedobacter gandavensis TaxID=2679963 RepID=UPI002931ACA8|nr:DUF805 domain-containing protein [Pedobacter gandavensis]